MNERQTWLVIGLAIGAAAASALREPLKPFGGAIRPLAKATVKAGLILGERGREKAAELTEMFEDLAVEVQAERQFDLRRQPFHRENAGEAEHGGGA